MSTKATMRAVLFLAAVAALTTPARAQQILLEPVRAGDLTLFRSLTNEKAYYYISDQPRLATGPDGKPQISLLRWVENKRSGAGDAEIREGDGGGIVHALVTLEVTPEQIQKAQSELQSTHPGARIEGPVMYENGTLGLVSNFKDPKGGLVEQVMGVGKAPLLDRQAAAVTMQLTKKGAQVLWESIQTPVPDISFTFEMQLAGFRPPVRAILEADFDQIYSHKAFAAGFASTHLGAEIEAVYDDLRRTGAIKLTQIGSDASMDQLIQTAYAQLSKIMFESAPDILKPGMGSSILPGAEAQSDSMLAKATSLLAASRADAAKSGSSGSKEPSQALKDARAKATKAEDDAKKAEDAAVKAKAAYEKAPDGKAANGKPADAQAEKDKAALKTAADNAQKAADDARKKANDAKAEADKIQAAEAKDSSGDGKKDLPTWAAVASFKMKEVHQSGKMTFDLNKYTESSVTLRFDGNVGDVRQFKDHFREVNLWSPLYQQREVVVYVDGANVADFGQYVNFVTVRLHKKHEGGAITDDEVLIDRNNFNKENNRFKLLYGWKGDNDRRHWMEYEYQTVWSLFGGKTVETPMQKATAQAIPVVAPYERRLVEVRANADDLAKAEVRSVNVKIFYDLGGSPQVKQATLDPAKPQTSQIEFMTLPGTVDYEYEITWRLKGNRTVTSGRQKASESWLDVSDVAQGS
jgi:hypothetical protein